MAINGFTTGKRQQLPVISTRKAHLTIDQRVWDASEIQNQQSQLMFSDKLQNVPTLKQALDSRDSDVMFVLPNGQ